LLSRDVKIRPFANPFREPNGLDTSIGDVSISRSGDLVMANLNGQNSGIAMIYPMTGRVGPFFRLNRATLALAVDPDNAAFAISATDTALFRWDFDKRVWIQRTENILSRYGNIAGSNP
jgi:hypothetical protein